MPDPKKHPPANDKRTKVTKAPGISFSQLQGLVEAAVKDAIAPGWNGPNYQGPYCYVRDMFDDYAVVTYDGDLWKVGYAYANGAVALVGQPTKVIETYVDAATPPAATPTATETTMATKTATTPTTKTAPAPAAKPPVAKVVKADDPGAAAPDGTSSAGDESTLGGDGADIVMLASQRLNDITDAIDAGGGLLTADLKEAVDGVVALLEAVAPDTDDGDENGIAAETEGTPEPMSASEKAMKETVKRRTAQSKAYIKRVAKMIRACKAEKDPEKVKAAKADIAKALEYGAEAFGNETGWMNGSSGETIPEFTDPAQVKPEEVATPAPANPRGQYAEDPNYQGAPAPGSTSVSGTPEFTEKLDSLRKRLGKPAGAPAPVAKGMGGAHAAWGPAYLATLPDACFLQVEPGVLKDAAGRSNLVQAGGSAFRHYAVKDIDGKLSGPQIRKALLEIPMAGLEKDMKASLIKQAEALLKTVEAQEASAVSKSARDDHGWPTDMNDPDFVAGVAKGVPAFGYDALAPKAAELKKAEDAAAATGK
jgi:hypothetical protein